LRETLQGKLEERLPLQVISLPKKFVQEYPRLLLKLCFIYFSSLTSDLAKNQQKLVTPFDIHATLQHILQLPNTSFAPREIYQESIFLEISLERNCKNARIADHWCVCQQWQIVDHTSSLIKNGTLLLLETINSNLI
jgi:hypothetical protein